MVNLRRKRSSKNIFIFPVCEESIIFEYHVGFTPNSRGVDDYFRRFHDFFW